ncbi:Premnaspirodiene oxygenase [Platanthera guangdongensis]|uniref:Premnaspirodiene oxygenase n=1 Tax=Platanthera guangdongensis TaxID=2320717 RepID=A0ABR2LJF6_9ASPA
MKEFSGSVVNSSSSTELTCESAAIAAGRHSSFGQVIFPLLIILGYLLVRWRSSYCRSKQSVFQLPPGPKPLPIIGNLHELLGETIHAALRRLSNEHGPLMHLKLGQNSAVIASSVETASEILRTQDSVFCTRPRLFAVNYFTYDGRDIGASPYGDRWRKLRRFATAKMFCPKKVKFFSFIRREEVEVLVSSIKKNASNAINISEVGLCLFNNITFREIFSKRVSADGDCVSSPHHGLIMDMMIMMAEFNVGDYFPSFRWLDFLSGWRFKLYRRFREMDRIFVEAIEQRMLSRRQNKEEGDFLDELLKREVELDPSIGFLFSRTQSKALLMDMFSGGSDTSSVALEWAMTELMKNPETMKKAQDEVRRVAGGDGKVEESKMEQLPYLKMVIKETLRLHPPTTLLAPHACLKDTKIHCYDVPAKTMAIVNVWAIGRDPKYWDQPEAFRPERFFGLGRRMCPGMTLGLASIQLALANLLYSFNWNLPAGMTAEDIGREERFGLSTRKKMPLLLMATPA